MIRVAAFQEGYSKGVLQAASDLGALLLESRTMALTLQNSVFESAKVLLGDLLKDEQLLSLLFQRYQGEWAAQKQGRMQVVLPLRCKPDRGRLNEAFKSIGVSNVDIQFDTQERYIFRMADQVIELDIGATQERLTLQLIAQLERLPESVRELDSASRELLVDWVSGFCEIHNQRSEVDEVNENC
ncbi:hypothetical protein PflCFBP13517_25695 [Pseudomonas fluorescens]|nr:hypothetical protein PflCFBP13517_25695 [Pseudomonas fluorescens]